MYTLGSLQQKNLKELKEIGWQLNVLPDGDRRCRRNWIKALVGVNPPLLQLLEVSSDVEPVQDAIEVQVQEPIEVQVQEPIEVQAQEAIEVQVQEPIEVQVQEPIEVQVQEPIEVQVQEPIEVQVQEAIEVQVQEAIEVQVQEAIEVQVQEAIESKFGRIVYPKPAVKPIAQNAETRPQLDRTESADVHNWRSHPAESVRDSSSAKAEALGSKEGDRVLALAGNSEAVRGGVLPRQPIELAATFNDEQPPKLNEYSPTGFGCPRCGAAYGLYIGKDCLDISEIKCLHCDYLRTTVDCPSCGAPHSLYTTKDYLGREIIKCLRCWYSRRKHYPGSILLEAEEPPIYVPETQDDIDLQDFEFQTTEPLIEVQVQEAIEVQAIGPIEIQAIEPIAPAAETSPGVSEGDRPLVLTKDAAETFPGVSRKTSTARQLLEQFKSSAVILGDSPAAETEAETLESAIGLAAKNLLDAEADQNPILTNITFSPGFLARYSPPRSENIHYQTDADGQLSLLDFEVESVDEPPDPDDFETLNAFREAIALWDATHPELIEIGLDSFSEWALCPDHWYKPNTLLEPHDSHIRPPQALTEQQPPGRGDGRGGYVEFAIGMLVGRRRDRLHLGKVLAIYKSRRGIWRAKIQPLNKPNFVYFDCSTLIEQRLLYDYEMKPGGFLPSGQIFDKNRGENFQVYSRKVRAKPTTWTPGQLSQLSTFKLKQIARDMEVPSIPGSAGKRSLIRAILAEQAISQEKAAAQRENSSQTAQKQKPASVASSKKRAAALLLESQLLLFDVTV